MEDAFIVQYVLPLLAGICHLSICLLFLVGVALVLRWLWYKVSAEGEAEEVD